MPNFDFTETGLSGLLLIKTSLYGDDRGYFMETYNQKLFIEAGISINFVQDNESCSKKGTLRGLHFQKPPFEQDKLVRVIYGEIFDVAVDIRPYSSTYGKWYGAYLSADNKCQLFIPKGFAHGFLALCGDTKVCYKCSDFYSSHHEGGIIWNDEQIGIDWPISDIEKLEISDKDKNWKGIENI